MPTEQEIEETMRGLDNIMSTREQAAREEWRREAATFAAGLRRTAEADVTASPAHVQGRLAALDLMLQHLGNTAAPSPEGAEPAPTSANPLCWRPVAHTGACEPPAAAPLGAGPEDEQVPPGCAFAQSEGGWFVTDRRGRVVSEAPTRERAAAQAWYEFEAFVSRTLWERKRATPPPQGEAAGPPVDVVPWVANWLRNGPAFAALQGADYDQPPADDAPDIMHDHPEAVEALLERLASLLEAGQWEPKPPRPAPASPHQGSGTAKPEHQHRPREATAHGVSWVECAECLEVLADESEPTPAPPGGPSEDDERAKAQAIVDEFVLSGVAVYDGPTVTEAMRALRRIAAKGGPST
jgi:hypothetical protein